MTDQKELDEVQAYWNRHLNCTQFLARGDSGHLEPGSDEFFDALEAVFERYPYKEALFREFHAATGGDKRLLEIGSGLGVELGKLARLGFDVTGIDLAPNAVNMANRYLQARGLAGKAQVGNAEALDFPDHTFDAVYSSGVLHHTPTIENAIAEIRRVLKPGGQLLVVLYHRRSWFYLLQRLSRVNVEFDDGDAPIINAYTAGEMHQLFAGFDNVRIDFEYYEPNRSERSGLLAGAYNNVFVPLMRAMPRGLVQRFGWHAVIRGSRPAD